MITQERFTALYNEASEIFDPKVRQLPLLEIIDDCPEVKSLENYFRHTGLL